MAERKDMEAIGLGSQEEPHIKARLAQIPGGRAPDGVWAYYRQLVGTIW